MKKHLTMAITLLIVLSIAVIPLSLSRGETSAKVIDFSDIPPYESSLSDVYPVICSDVFFALYGIEGDMIEFDGYVAQDTHGVITVCPGDFADRTDSTWGFQINNPISDFLISRDDNVTVQATIMGRSDDSMVLLGQARIEPRTTRSTQSSQTTNDDTNTPSTANEADFSDEFAAILALKNPRDESKGPFAAKYQGETIEFDGYVYSVDDVWPDKYDITIHAGQFKDASVANTAFLMKGVTVKDLGFDTEKLPTSIRYGSDVHVIAKIVGYDDWEACILVEPSLLEKRVPLLEGLNTSAFTVLEKGSKGDSVKTLQQRLIDLKYLAIKVDGKYGKKTVEAVSKFQSSCGLEVTGVADPATQAILFSENAPEAHLTVSCSSIVVGSSAKTVWCVDGQEFTLKGKKTKTIKTLWGTYKFYADGHYDKIED